MKTLALIPARAGSKGVRGKNTKLLAGKPLLQYTIEAAKAVFAPEQICVSTDSEEIKACAEKAGLQVPFLRPSALATDTAGMREVMLHALGYYAAKGFTADVVLLLQPTSPFRTSQHIREALQLFRLDIDMVVSVKETKSNPYFNLFEENEEGFLQLSKSGTFTRRQDCPNVWEYNGAVYVINTQSLREMPVSGFSKVKKYEMDEVSSLDIDTELDWKLAELLTKEGAGNKAG